MHIKYELLGRLVSMGAGLPVRYLDVVGVLAIGCFVGGGAATALAYRHWRDPSLSHYEQTRERYVLNKVKQSGPVDTLVLGDSIFESTWLLDACGVTFNASVGGSRVPIALEIAKVAIPRLKPKRVVVETGTNYFAAHEGYLFKPDYRKLVDFLKGQSLILVGTPRSAEATAYIEQTAKEIGAKFVPPITGSLTFEGVHPTPQGGLLYRKRIEEACAA